jgi:phosphoribosyl-AMP cyclohydrolase
MSFLDEITWDAQGLVPVIAQEVGSNDVLMFAFMNREAVAETAAGARRCTGAARATACGTRAKNRAHPESA